MGTAATQVGDWFTVEETAVQLKVSKPTIYRRVQSGTLPAVKLGGVGQIRIPAEGLEEFLQRSAVCPPPAEASARTSGASADLQESR